MTLIEELEARQQLEAPVDNRTIESDKDNQDYYVKQDGHWLIAERDQYFVFSDTGVIGK